ncbi:UDP-glucose:(heptosyl) LPS alpha1,3-glucosyltransferase WaaG [Methylophaga lonarensis MPL]|uniref:UDP-glucose:(Heptosyl) LPS alpha1,3-glucosyltransferase WaaG n=1 Tax=Methylophaga lonarensis MPL TaxID=1286106 RepID=M7NXZ0_9GAMM|nr:glycosyltransferase family 4 protein [Methylophaga lonarensis]EMR13668.1 UDP-glucose:(heptosyl) LPS alpha1,3-glucosyltransferase WaaG [Methylophaga lonarensis MPL]
MKLAVCLYKYFAYGGLARDFRRILELRRDAGDEIDVYCIEWHGADVPGFNRIDIEVSGLSNHARVHDFYQQVKPQLDAGNYDLVIGFNKMPGLDLYYAADPCYLAKAQQDWHYPVTRYFGRVKFYSDWERAVFGPDSHTVSMMISSVQRRLFEHHYGTPAERLVDLPPGIDPQRTRPADWQQQRQQLRQTLGLADDDFLLLMIGSGFKRKGVDFAISALAALPAPLRSKTHIYVVGEDKQQPFVQQAQQLNVAGQVHFMGGRDDVPQWLQAADLFMHPARSENTGTVILEAMVAGLPQLVSKACGYANHVEQSQAGELIADPENTAAYATLLTSMLQPEKLQTWSEHALNYARTEDLYSMPEKAAALIEHLVEQQASNKQ